LQGLTRRKPSEGARHGTEHTRLRAVADDAVARGVRPYAAQTRAAAVRPHHLQLALVLVHAREDDRLTALDAHVVQQELGGEVVRAVNDEVMLLDELRGGARVEA